MTDALLQDLWFHHADDVVLDAIAGYIVGTYAAWTTLRLVNVV
ncbi:hypothetical protein ACFW9N_37190 [Streptomyces sp. NPDC059496]